MNKSLLFVLFGLVQSQMVQAQQVPFYNHYFINPFVFNPAMAGASGDVNAFLVRNQRYTGFNGASVNNYLSIDGAFMKDKGGFGIQVSHQACGIQQQLASSLTYAYGVRFRDLSQLRFGVTAGLLDNRIDLAAINVMDANDPYLATMRQKVSSYDFNAGLSYIRNSLRIGFAVPQLIGNKVAYDKQNARGYYRLARHFMLSGEYDLRFKNNKSVILRPNALMRYVPGAPLQYDVMATVDHAKMGWVSLGYKSGYSVQMNIGFRIMKQLRVGYSYEYLVGSMKNYSTGAHHEIMLGLTFREKEKPVEVIKIVEREVIVKDTVALADATREKEELEKKNRELEERLQQSLMEKDSLEKENKVLEEKQLASQTTGSGTVNAGVSGTNGKPTNPGAGKPTPGLEEIKVAKGYKFIELNQANSPDGFYVVTGVFSSTTNANASLARNKKYFPEAYLVINQKNGYYYVILKYTEVQLDAVNVEKKFEKTLKKDAWVLNYRAPQE